MDRRSLLKNVIAGAAVVAAGGTSLTKGLAQESTPDTTGPITIQDALGEVTLEQPAQRVVALEWTYVEDVLALGIQPIGVADIEGYKAWVNIEPQLDEDVTDVGTRQEPSLEAIAALEPDLIIGPLFRLESVVDSLRSIAPTLLFNPYPEDPEISQFQEMLDTARAIGDACGKPDEAEAVLTQMNDAFEAARQTLEEAGRAGEQFVLCQAYSNQGAPQLRLFIDSAMAVEELLQIGLENAFEGSPDIYGYNTVGVEALVEVQDANFLYIVQDEDNVFANQLAENPVWQNLNFVKEGRAYPLGGSTWTFGGPLSGITFVNRTVDVLTGAEDATPTA